MLNHFFKQLCLTVLLSTSLNLPLWAKIDYVVEDQPEVIEQVVLLEQKGILKQKANGYVYVEVSNDFIAHSLPLIQTTGIIIPSHDYTGKNGIGAHISVITENELDDQSKWEIEEIGQEFSFQVMEVRTVKMKGRDQQIKKLWLIAVEAPELVSLREKYGLSSYLKGHDYHVTLGSQVLKTAQKVNKLSPYKK